MVAVAVMIDETLAELESWNLDEEQATTLLNDMTADDTTFQVTVARGTALGITVGVIEVESELMYVDTVDGTNVSVTPWGRGYKHTTATTHSAGARIVSQPTFPRAKVLDKFNSVLSRVFPQVYAVKQVETVTTVPRFTYDLPNDAQRALQVRWQVPDGTGYWVTARRFRMSSGGGTELGDTNRSIDIGDSIPAGRPLQILYSAAPAPLTSESDDFETVTGLGSGLRDVIVLGAASALTISQETSRLQTSSIEQQNRSQLVAPSAALTTSRYLDQRFQERLLEERNNLQELYPPRITPTWR